jgi:putative hydrolase of the HAD superfamily
MNVSKWQAIVFDLDDTLYPERNYVLSGFHAVAEWGEAHLGIPASQGMIELRKYFDAGVRGKIFNHWLESHQLPIPVWVDPLVQVYRNHKPTIRPFDGVPELLEALHAQYRLGLVSDGYLAGQERKLEALGLESLFDAIVFSDAWGREAWKPSPIPFWTILQQLGTTPTCTMYVADNALKDFVGARQAGMFTLWVRRAEGEYARHLPPREEFAPHATISSLDELRQILEILEKPE